MSKTSHFAAYLTFTGLAACGGAPTHLDADMPQPTVSRQARAVAVIEALETQDPSAIEAYVSAETYIQHNLAFPDGRDALLGALASGALEGTTVDIKRVLVDGDYVVLHVDYTLFGQRQIGFDVFRFEGDLIVEHWDNLQPYDGQPNPSGRTMVDGPVEVVDLDRTAENEAVVRGLLDEVFLGGNFGAIADYIDPAGYLQHNPLAGDGLEALGAVAERLHFERSVQLHAEGNFALAMSEGTFDGAPTAFFDLFRLEGGKIVEHWDVIQAIPDEAEWANENGKF